MIRPYLDAAERADQSKVVAVGEAREFQWVFDATRKEGPDGVPWFRFYRTERLVTCYYFYIHDRRVGPAFIKVCAYAPYPAKAWCNGHEIARRAALAEGTGTPIWTCIGQLKRSEPSDAPRPHISMIYRAATRTRCCERPRHGTTHSLHRAHALRQTPPRSSCGRSRRT
jgi:hypothetical protein